MTFTFDPMTLVIFLEIHTHVKNTVASFTEIPPLSKEISCHKLGVNKMDRQNGGEWQIQKHSLCP